MSLRINCPTCGLPVLYAKKNIHNCITDLQKSIQHLSKCLLEAHKPVKRIWLPGNPGEVCQFGDSEDEAEIYSDIEAENISQSQQSQGTATTEQHTSIARRCCSKCARRCVAPCIMAHTFFFDAGSRLKSWAN
jgi:hypothetical protein